MRAVAGHALRESVRRRVFSVVVVLSLAYLALYALAVGQVLGSVEDFTLDEGIGTLDAKGVVNAYLLGLGCFAILFLGAILAVFLTLGAVRGDAERGVLQPLLVRPVGRAQFLAGRFAAAGAVAAAYVLLLYGATLVIAKVGGGRWPDRILEPGVLLALAVLVLVLLSLLGSIVLSSTANGIAMFMVFGGGLVAGLTAQIADAIGSEGLTDASRIVAYALPFEALYQAALHALTADQTGFTGALIELGPFGGAQEGGPELLAWCAFYGVVAWLAARRLFEARDL